MAGAWALAGLKMGTLTVPGIGTITGPVVGALAGLFSGTIMCTSLNISMRQQLKSLANEH